MDTPPGWAQDSGNPNKYNATLTATNFNTEIGTGSLTQRISVQVDNTTGVIGLVGGGAAFYQYDPKLNKWKIPTEGDEYFDSIADQTDVYTKILKDIGLDELNNITSTAKLGAVKVIDGTSDAVDKEKIKESDGYKGALNNTAPDAGDANDGGGSLPTDQPISEPEGNKSLEVSYENYSYPESIIEQSTVDVIEFKQFKYGKKSVGDGGSLKISDRNFGNPIDGSVTLAIPAGIQDSNRVNWTDDNANAFELQLARASLDMMQNFVAGSQNAIERLKEAALDKEVKNAGMVALAGKASGLQNANARFNGAILNPNTELLFGGPGLRDFAYTIEMAPRSSKEALQIRNIIRFFKQGMAPRKSTTGLFLNAPNVFEIKYICYVNGGGEKHPYINKVKGKCALRNCSVDYTPQNSYMTYKEDGSMTAYRMTLQFTELEPVYFDDYLEGEGLTGIGY